MARSILAAGAIFGFIGVAAGAFAAHGLKARIEPDLLIVFETGARYQMYHAVALVLVGVIGMSKPSRLLSASGWAMVAGILIFSGSLYLLALTGVRWLGAITPIGGLAFLVGWALLAVAALKKS